MTTNQNLIITIIILLIIIIYKIYEYKKVKKSYRSELYKKAHKLNILLATLSLITFVILIIINTILSPSGIISNIINSLAIAFLIFPVSLHNHYEHSFADEEKTSHIKTIITNKFDLKLMKKFRAAGINIIYLNKEPNEYFKNIIEEDDISKKYLLKTIQIKSSNIKIIDKLINKENTIKETKDLNKIYNLIEKSRGTHDNYIRTIKYLITTYLPLLLSYIFLTIMNFPITMNILLISILKLLTLLISRYVYKTLPYDKDLMERKVKNKNIFMGKQEIMLMILECFIIFFCLTIPYMYTLAQGGSRELANTIFLIIFIYSNIFVTYSNLSETIFIINITKIFKNLKLFIYTLVGILLTLFFNFIPYFKTRNIYLHNYISCVLFALLSILFIEITKLARYTTTKGKKKNDTKNNKKYKRS